MVQMTALRSHRYGNRKITAGDVYTVTRRDARVLTAIRYSVPAEELPEEVAPPVVVIPAVEETPKRRRRKVLDAVDEPPAEPVEPSHYYERRDMRAEDPQE